MNELYRLDLLGAFRLVAPDGSRIQIPAKRSRILLAMLATSRSGERSRRWLQERIWGSRDRPNAQASLRRELANLRPLVNVGERPLLIVSHESIALDLDRVSIDVRDPAGPISMRGEFLEGIDLAWEEGFEDWLREERQMVADMRETNRAFAQDIAPFDLPSKPAVNGRQPTLSVIVHYHDLAAENLVAIKRLGESLAECLAKLDWLPIAILPPRPVTISPGKADVDTNWPKQVDYLLHCQPGYGGTLMVMLFEVRSGRSVWSRQDEFDTAMTSDNIERVTIDIVSAVSTQIWSLTTRPVWGAGV